MLRKEKLQALLMRKLKPTKLKTQNKSNKKKLKIKKMRANKVKNQMIIRKNFDVLFMIFVSNINLFRFYYKSIKIYFYFEKKVMNNPQRSPMDQLNGDQSSYASSPGYRQADLPYQLPKIDHAFIIENYRRLRMHQRDQLAQLRIPDDLKRRIFNFR